MQYNSIITHNDFDGVVSAVICDRVFNIGNIKFAGPNNIAKADLTITGQDIVCDLPYPLECGLWFDHHEGNLEEIKYRGIDLETIPGKFELLPSCARVVYNYFNQDHQFPDFFESLINDADQIDSFDYSSIQEWRQETPSKIVDATIRSRIEHFKEKRRYLEHLVFELKDRPICEVANEPLVTEKYQQYQQEEQQMLKLIKSNISFLPQDKNREIIILDISEFKRPPHIIKNLAYLLYPESLAVFEIKPIFRRGIKTNDLSLSLSLSINLNKEEHAKDVGNILRQLNLGDGHKGAAGGTLYCNSKQEKSKQKNELLNQIFTMWQDQK